MTGTGADISTPHDGEVDMDMDMTLPAKRTSSWRNLYAMVDGAFRPRAQSLPPANNPRNQELKQRDGKLDMELATTNTRAASLLLMLLEQPPRRQLCRTLPAEVLALALTWLDGKSLLQCALTCRALAKWTFDREVWTRLCMQQWPTLRLRTLPQLPGAPDYDLVRLYGGCWRRCFVEQNRLNQRATLSVTIPQFASVTADRIESPPFNIGEHRFCLWIFPQGNPNEATYAGHVLSVYLVLKDTDRRPQDWQTCAVFSLAVVNHGDPEKTIEWNSCLMDNKFNAQLYNWGVHSIGSLKVLRDPSQGYLDKTGGLTITANVRLMSITFRVVFEVDLKRHRGLGMADLSTASAITLPFCATLQDLLDELEENFGVNPEQTRLWCFNQPVVSGQALRPRKLLTTADANKNVAMFGHSLCDGVDIDAYSFCQLYVECLDRDDPPLVCNSISPMVVNEDGEMEVVPIEDHASSAVVENDHIRFLFVKFLQPETQELCYLGRLQVADTTTVSELYDRVAQRLDCLPSALTMFKEEIAPSVTQGPISTSSQLVWGSKNKLSLQPADVVVFSSERVTPRNVMREHLFAIYRQAQAMLDREIIPPTLQEIETLGERLEIPKFRVRSAFRKCKEDGRLTLRFIMEGRHLGFICDSCGETDFRGLRFNCSECNDYDLCARCNAASMDHMTHRYCNVDGKWQRIHEYFDHKAGHSMRELRPAFYDFNPHHCTEIKIRPVDCHSAGAAW